jgi:hypothetical protein
VFRVAQDVADVQFWPPAISTRPLLRSVTVWPLRGTVIFPALVKYPNENGMLNSSALWRDAQFPLESQEYPPASKTLPFGRSTAGAERAVVKLEVLPDVAVSGL